MLPRPFWLFDRKLKTPSYNSYRSSLWWIYNTEFILFIFLKAADFRFLNYIDIRKYRYLALVCLLFCLFRYFLVHGQALTMPHLHAQIFQPVRVATIQRWTSNQDSISNKRWGQTIFMAFRKPARVAIHYSHRVTALVLTFFMLILIGCLWFTNAAPLSSTLGLVLLFKFL